MSFFLKNICIQIIYQKSYEKSSFRSDKSIPEDSKLGGNSTGMSENSNVTEFKLYDSHPIVFFRYFFLWALCVKSMPFSLKKQNSSLIK